MVAKRDIVVSPEQGNPFEKARHPFELAIVKGNRFVRPDPTRDGAPFGRRNQRAHEKAALTQRRRKFSLRDGRVIDPPLLLRDVKSSVEES
jgi:hypothetical protein